MDDQVGKERKMKKNASLLSIAYFTFLLLVIFSGSLSGILSEAMYFLAFILPFFAVVLFTDRERPRASDFSLSTEGKRLFLPTVFPTVFVIALLSIVTSSIITHLGGAPSSADVGDSLIFALFYHALLPSVLEELLFRYLPMRYIASESCGFAVIFSAVFFALVHHSFFSMPYALFAGAAFMTVNLLAESCLPSIILHFVNNAVSVVWTFYFSFPLGNVFMMAVLFALSAISAVFIVRNRRKYAEALAKIFDGAFKHRFPIETLFAAAIAISAAVLELVR
jgi:membrane protease YdiL (CAAX protease family)